MHGFALDFLLKKKMKKGLADLAENKPIRYVEMI